MQKTVANLTTRVAEVMRRVFSRELLTSASLSVFRREKEAIGRTLSNMLAILLESVSGP